MNARKMFIMLAMFAGTTMACAQNATTAGNSSVQCCNASAQKEALPTFMTHDQMSSKMITDLALNEKQAKEVKSLNEKYARLIEGPGQMRRDSLQNGERPKGGHRGGGPRMDGGPGMGHGGPGMGQGGPQGSNGQTGNVSDQSKKNSMAQELEAYETELKKILTDDQMTGFEKIKPSFACQQMMNCPPPTK